MPARIVVVGSYNTDLVAYMPQLPQFGETVNAHKFTTGPGGKGSNQAVAAARLGAQAVFVGCVGQDSYAEIGFKLWQHEGVNTRYVVRSADHPTGVASIFVEDSGENMIVVAMGANLALTPAHVDAAVETLAHADLLITQLETPLNTVAHILKVAKERGVRTILNPAPAAHVPKDVLALADYLTPNESELEALAGARSSTAEEDARALLANESQTVIVTLGAWGAVWVQKEQHGHVAGYPVNAKDTVGAGDAFNAGLAVALAEGRPLPEAVNFANAVAAVSTTKPGAATGMPRREEVEAFIRANPVEADEG